MRIKMLTTMAGPDGSANAGQVIDMDDERAVALLEGGYAEAVKAEVETVEVETAAVEAPEQAVTRGPGVKRRRTRRAK